jgi:hypothetical protein
MPASKTPKHKKPTIAVRPPPAAVDAFVLDDTAASKRHDAITPKRQSAMTPKRATPTRPPSTTRYTTKDGSELRRVTLWLPAEAAEAIGTFAARHQLRDSHIAALAVCKLLGVKPPASLAHVAALFPK